MEIVEPEIAKVPVVDYDFTTVIGGKGVVISIWPTLGDSVVRDERGFTFHFPRMKETQEIFFPIIGLKIRHSDRPDPVELIKRAKEAHAKKLEAGQKAATANNR